MPDPPPDIAMPTAINRIASAAMPATTMVIAVHGWLPDSC